MTKKTFTNVISIPMKIMTTCTINIRWSKEDNEYVATVKEFKNISGLGETPLDALNEVNTALELFVKTALESK